MLSHKAHTRIIVTTRECEWHINRGYTNQGQSKRRQDHRVIETGPTPPGLFERPSYAPTRQACTKTSNIGYSHKSRAAGWNPGSFALSTSPLWGRIRHCKISKKSSPASLRLQWLGRSVTLRDLYRTVPLTDTLDHPIMITGRHGLKSGSSRPDLI